MDSDWVDIRQFLRERFNDLELDAFCFDYFADAQQNFAYGMTRERKIQLLLEHCRMHNRQPDLLAALQRERPGLYEEHFGIEIMDQPTAELPQPHSRNPRQIFLSHAHQDAVLAHRFAQDLRDNGWQVWIAPNSIQPGEKWVEAIGRGLDESGVFVLLVTKAAVASRWVKDETNLAIQLEKDAHIRFFPIVVESTKMPIMWQAYQHIPFFQDYGMGIQSLLAHLDSKPLQKQLPKSAYNLRERLQLIVKQYSYTILLIVLIIALLGWWGNNRLGGVGRIFETPTSSPSLLPPVDLTKTSTPTATITGTPTQIPTSTPTLTVTLTPQIPTETPTNTPSNTPTSTSTNTPTNTPSPTLLTNTFTPIFTSTSVLITLTNTPRPPDTPRPPTNTPKPPTNTPKPP